LNRYEAIFILNPKLTDEELAGVKTDLRGKLEAAAAQDILETKCERRPLYYAIKKLREAIYLVYRFGGPGDTVAKLRTELKHYEAIMRMSYVRVPDSAAAPAVEKAAPAPATEKAAPTPEPAATPTPTPAPAAE
jgi:small subunit ribosomal protein S6